MHIHSVLSPCGDYLMTPNNILNMSSLCNLNIIAVCDHNSLLQLKVFHELQESFDLLVINGVELQVEKGHLLVYFSSFAEAMRFQEYLETIIIKRAFDEKFYGEEILTDIYDNTVNKLNYLLIDDLDIDLNTLLKRLSDFNCLKVAAHLDKKTTSLLENINEENYHYFDALEIIDYQNLEAIYQRKPYLRKKFVLQNSDAHQIIDINEDINCLDLPELSYEGLCKVIKNE